MGTGTARVRIVRERQIRDPAFALRATARQAEEAIVIQHDDLRRPPG